MDSSGAGLVTTNILMNTKKCFKCLKELPLADFYLHKETADGHLNKCKKCTIKDATANRARNRIGEPANTREIQGMLNRCLVNRY